MKWDEAILDLEKRREKAKLGGGAARIEKQHLNGKMTARERIDILLDKDTFVEVDGMIESRIDDFDLDKRRVAGDGVVTGYGEIDGRLVFVASEDFTVIGGTLGEYHSFKICRIQDMAMEMKAPFICINDSGGARIEEGISSLSGYSGMFLRHTKASGVIPQIAVILGPCSGGACYAPAICDFIFMVKDISKMFITGPNVVKTVINEEVSTEELGGAKVHAEKSGVSHFTYETEGECLMGVRKLLTYLPSNYMEKAPVVKAISEKQSFLYAVNKMFGKKGNLNKVLPQGEKDKAQRLREIVPDNSRRAYDVKEVIHCLVDEGSFFEVQKEFAPNGVIGWGRMEGEVVGFVANQPESMGGSLDYQASDKIARFIRFCDCFNIPLVTLVDVPAFLPGTQQEHNGIIRHGAKILYAYSEATVPKISVIMRKAYGGAYIAMNSKEMGADMVFAWPIAEIAVMGAEGAVNIAFRRKIKAANDPQAMREQCRREYEERFLNPYVAAARGFVNEVIKPEETREKLLKALKALRSKSAEGPKKKHGNIPL
ncbi:MAG: acyl-CoA carboxylase subunit beta [Lachnospiraceae bacterium]|jgi:acetyl-CoA carboxylase carboxyltransferase component|nr:acyl-CoA carboxylase subunit beta [Lachnospiraceae bacterium]MCI9342422.1 acyl-CoA carboxylase subunit beta [Lachnospiraceae bacterium]GFH91276.1 propionyl-CoA carboxylase beta chain [Lachnospiraceae bacterium]